jgi:beta-galactosidase/beta-glucuronidase
VQSEITQTLTNQTLEIKRLQGQIIQSPAKLRTTLKDLAQSVEKENEEVRRLEAKERQMGIKISSLQKYEGVSLSLLSPGNSLM